MSWQKSSCNLTGYVCHCGLSGTLIYVIIFFLLWLRETQKFPPVWMIQSPQRNKFPLFLLAELILLTSVSLSHDIKAQMLGLGFGVFNFPEPWFALNNMLVFFPLGVYWRCVYNLCHVNIILETHHKTEFFLEPLVYSFSRFMMAIGFR